MKRLDKLSAWLSDALMVVGCGAILAMMLHVVADVLAKFFWNLPIEGTIEIVEIYYMVAVVFLPFAYVTRTEGQIVVELFTQGLSPRRRAGLETVVGVVTLAAIALLTWETGADAVSKTLLGELRDSGEGAITAWPSRWLLPFGAGAMALTVFEQLVRDAHRCWGGSE